MAVEQYINIDGLNDLTTWWCPAYNTWYSNVTGFEESTDQVYSKVAVEVPAAMDGVVTIGGYWSADPVGMTKLTTSATTTPSEVFQLSYIPYSPSMKVYINGRPIAFTLLASPGTFQVDLPCEDGYMWVEYVVDTSDAAKTLGDTRATLEAQDGIIAGVIYPDVTDDLIIRIRRAINNIEAYLGIIPTIWTGGKTNTLRSGPSNIIPGTTPVYADHILEMVAAVQRVENRFDTMIPITYPRYTFYSTYHTDVFMIQYVEDIMEAIQRIERTILDSSLYGG